MSSGTSGAAAGSPAAASHGSTGAVGWGILGAARIAETALAPAIAIARGAHLVALGTANPDKARAIAAQHPGMRLHDSYQAVLDDPAVEAVYIPLPNHLHMDWTLRALDAGKHVLCEKPIALDAAEIDRLIAARDTSGRLAAEAFMVVHHPQWQHVRRLLAEGAIGRLAHVEGAFTYNNPDPANYRNQAGTGGGGLRDVGVYPCVTTRFATGAEPDLGSLRADIRHQGPVDTFARVWAEFPGFTMSFYCGMRQTRHQEMTFHGSDGLIRLNAPFNARRYGDTRVETRRADGTVEVARWNAVDQYACMVEAFGATIRDGGAFACPLEFSRGNQAMIDAILGAKP